MAALRSCHLSPTSLCSPADWGRLWSWAIIWFWPSDPATADQVLSLDYLEREGRDEDTPGPQDPRWRPGHSLVTVSCFKGVYFVLRWIGKMLFGSMEFFSSSTSRGHWEQSVHCHIASQSRIQFLEYIHGTHPHTSAVRWEVLTLNVLCSNTADFQWRTLIHITILLFSLRDLGSTQCQWDSVHL